MADNIDPQQIDDLNENLKSLIETMGGVSSKGPSVSKGLGEMLGASKTTTKFLEGLGTSATGLGKALYKGEKGAGVFGDAVEEAAGAVSLLLIALGPFSLAAKLAAVAITAFAKGLNAAAKQGDALYKTYQDLQKSGATAADGITGVFNNMQKFGYGIEELDKMTRLVSENSQTLARFSLTAADGTNAFASEMQGLVRDKGLKVLGKMPEEINAAGAAYIKQQVAIGRNQKDIGDTLGASTKQYIMDLDRLQRLTGTSADQLQKQQDEAMSEDAYNDVMAELRARADAGDASATAQIKKITTTMASLSPEMQKEFQRSIGGDISAQQKLMMRMPTLMRNVTDESVSIGKTMDDAKTDITNYVDAMGKSYRLNSEGMREYGGTLRSAREEITQFGNWEEREKAADKNATVTDQATDSLAQINLEQMNSRDALQSFVQLGVAPATRAMAGLAKATTSATSVLPGAGPAGENSIVGKLDAMAKAGAKPMVPTGSGAGVSGSAVAPGMSSILNLIGRGESQGNYNKLVYGKKGFNTPDTADLTNMTIAQVQEYQKGMIARGHASTAVGKYQMIADTLSAQVKKSGLDPTKTKFDQKTQDLLASQLVMQAGFGTKDPTTVMKNLAGTWASMPQNMSGRGTYDGFNSNRASVSPKDVLSAISGPDSGYKSQLSGLNPTKSLQVDNAKTPATTNTQVASDTSQTDLLHKILQHMEIMSYTSQRTAENTHKTAKNTA